MAARYDWTCSLLLNPQDAHPCFTLTLLPARKHAPYHSCPINQNKYAVRTAGTSADKKKTCKHHSIGHRLVENYLVLDQETSPRHSRVCDTCEGIPGTIP